MTALGTALGVDTQLIADRTYYAAEALLASGETIIVACGGWSQTQNAIWKRSWAVPGECVAGSA